MISCNIWLPVVIHRSKTRNNALDVFWGIETIIVNLAFSWVLVKLQFQLMKVKNISPKLSARANYTFSGMTILQHEPAAAPKKVFLPCVSLPRANFYENIFYNAFALGLSLPRVENLYTNLHLVCTSLEFWQFFLCGCDNMTKKKTKSLTNSLNKNV